MMISEKQMQYYSRIGNNKSLTKDIKVQLKAELDRLIDENQPSTEAEYREILQILHQDKRFDVPLNKAKIKTISAFNLYKIINNRAIEKIRALQNYLNKQDGNALFPKSNIPWILNQKLDGFYKNDSYTPEYPGKNGIRNHTEKVIENFNTYFAKSFEKLTGLPVELMQTTLALHDIGKGNTADKTQQHAQSKSVIKQYRDVIQINKKQSNIISDIIAQDPVGELFQMHINQEQAAVILNNSYLKLQKNIPNLTKKQYFELIKIYYSCDAASYLYLKNKIFTSKMEFKTPYDKIISSLETGFFQENRISNPQLNIRYYNDDHLLCGDFISWFNKHKDSFPEGAVAVFDIDGTITEYEKQDISKKPHMINIMKELSNAGVKIILLTNRPSNQFPAGDQQITQKLSDLEIKVESFFHNDSNTPQEYKSFKKVILANVKDNIICSFGDKLNDLHNFHSESANYGNGNFKSKSFWVHYMPQNA